MYQFYQFLWLNGTYAHVCRKYDQCGEIGVVQKDGSSLFGHLWHFLALFQKQTKSPTISSLLI